MLILFGMFATPVLAKELVIWEPINEGMDRGVIQELVMDPRNSSILYAGTPRGIYKSIDAGQTWFDSSAGMKQYFDIQTIVFDRKNPNMLYAGVKHNGVYKSFDNGKTWQRLRIAASELSVYSLDIHPVDNTILLIGTNDGIYRSEDQGSTWAKSSWPLDFLHVTCVLFHPHNLQKVFAGTDGDGLFISLDGGFTWKEFADYSMDRVRSIVLDPSNPFAVYYLSEYTLHKSFDYGETWSQSHGLSTSNTMFLDPNDSKIIYVGTYRGVFRSTDGGYLFEFYSAPFGHENVLALIYDPNNPSNVYSGLAGGGVYKSTDGALTWQLKSKNLHAADIKNVVFHEENPNILYAATYEGGVYKSLDNGNHWEPINQGISDLRIGGLAIHPANPEILFVGNKVGSLYKSTNAGATWTEIHSFIDHIARQLILIAIDPKDPSRIFLGDYHSGFYKSSDGGETWKEVNVGVFLHRPCDVSFHPTLENVVYLASGNGFFKSTDSGETWENYWDSPIPKDINNIAIDTLNPDTIYLSGYDGGFYKTMDGGETWQAHLFGLRGLSVNMMKMDPSSESLLAGTFGGGMFRSRHIQLDHSLYLPMMVK